MHPIVRSSGQEGSLGTPLINLKPESDPKPSTIETRVFDIAYQVRKLSEMRSEIFIEDSEKLNDLINRISKIRIDVDKEKEHEGLSLQLNNAENTLNRILDLKKKPPIIVTISFDTSEKEISFDADLVRHLKTLENFRKDMGPRPIPLDKSITPETFNAIIKLLTILPSDLLEKPEGRSNLFDIALLKAPIAVPLLIRKDNWILIFNTANYLDCPPVMRLCTDFAERHVSLGDFNPTDSKKPDWAYFVKRMPEQFLNKMAHDFLINPVAYEDLFSLFGSFIKKLDIQNPSIDSDMLNKLLIKCPNIEELNLACCKDVTEIPAGFTRLKKLDVSYTKLTQEALNSLPARCPGLEELNLSSNEAITGIPAGFTRLKKLDVAFTKLRQEALNSLPTKCPDLEKLNLAWCKDVAEIPAGFTRLKKLDVTYTKLKQEALNSLPARCPGIEELNLYGLAITEIPAGFTRLKKLDVTYTKLKQEALNSLSTKYPGLEELNLYGVEITEIPAGFTRLRKLSVGNTCFKQEALNTLAVRCPQLEELDLRSNEDIVEIPKVFTRLKKLYVLFTGLKEEEEEEEALNTFAGICPDF